VKVSVVVCTYSPEAFDHFVDAANSVLAQTHDDVELVVVVDGDETLAERVRARYGTHDAVRIHCNDENRGLSASRNVGIDLASGDVVAFMDDDAVAHPDWVERLVACYRDHDAVAAGGRMAPRWVAGEPAFLPAEFYWLVGVTHRGFPTEACEVRNTFGSNISFRRGVFEEVGVFEPDLGRAGEKNLQGEETEFAARVRRRYGQGVWYDPDAVVEHKVFDYRTDPRWLFERAFWQGYSKRVMADVLPDGGDRDDDGGGREGRRSDGSGGDADEESEFLRRLLFEFGPGRLRRLVRRPRRAEALQFVTLVALTATVGFGYLYATLDRLR
jgi:glycosyltransferase involved in cell wall biosynthesis